ncbi:glutathione S-transferase family protein [Corynebacterium alimapuense]|uniref:Glutathione-dependent reductase n=1 Tax=Corynebacterium alimapuense TaxID=1576874 RepID=A0A3M8K6I9_9CORY|nr:glutathione S-transferase C-terminal domain-containing protein [Corynebacterium alimapuense]RNE48355.1 glutathione-dependent reductase [Corynebacterium alimapuense]
MTTDNPQAPAGTYASTTGAFVRDTNYIADRITAAAPAGAATSQDDGTFHWPVEANRYRLVAARACPWAHRAVIVRRLMGLESVISLALAGPTHDQRSWTFDLDPDAVDPVLGITRLQEAYFNRFPDYPRGITVPALVEESSRKVVSNDFPSLVRDLITQWGKFQRPGAPDLWPSEHVEEMERLNKWIFTEINNGVYRCGFAGSQDAYDDGYDRLWSALDQIEERLSTRRYLVGDHITETDIRLFVTLIRFDAVYYSHFKTARNKITEMPNLWGYLRELFQLPGFGDTTDFTEIKQHYFLVHRDINPTGIIPGGPDLSGLATAHGREIFGGSPFAPGTTLPGAMPPGEELKNPEPFQNQAPHLQP